MPHGIASGKFHGAMTAHDAARRVAQLVALAGHLEERRAARRARRAARVVLEEVDRLADVGVGLAPTASRTRGPRARRARARRSRIHAAAREQDLGARSRRAWRAQRGEAARRGRDGRGGLVGARRSPRRDDALGRRPGRSRRAPRRRARSSPIHTGTRSGSSRRARAARRQRLARCGARRSSRIGSLANGRQAHRRGQQLLERDARCACSAQEGLVATCSRAAGARGRPCRRRGRRPGSRCARAGPRAASACCRSSPRPRRTWSSRSASAPPSSAVGGDRVRDRAQVVRGDRDAHARAARRAAARVSASKLRSQSALSSKTGDAPAVLARLDDLVVPVGALDEPHDERLARGGARAPSRAIRVEQLGRVAQVGLQDDARARAVAELGLGEQLEDELEDRLARVAATPCRCAGARRARGAAQQLAQARRGVALAALGRLGAQQRRERARP